MSGQQYELANPPSDAISSVRFSLDTKHLAVGAWDSTVSIYSHSSESDPPYVLAKRIKCRSAVLDVCWGSNDDFVFSVGLDGDVRQLILRNDAAESEQQVLSTHDAASNKLAYDAEHDMLISTSWDSTMHVHLLSHQPQRVLRVRLAAKPYAVALGSTLAVIAMASRHVSVFDLSALKALVEQAGSMDDKREALDVKPWQQRESSLKFMARAVACMPDNAGFAVSSIEGRVGVEWFDPNAQAKTYAFKCHRRTTKANMINDDGEEVEQEVDVVYPVNALAFHSLYGTFATGGGDGVVTLWDAQTKRRVRQYPQFDASVASLDFSADGRWLAIGVSPGFEDGEEDGDVDPEKVKIMVRALGEAEAKPKAKKEEAAKREEGQNGSVDH